MRAIERALMVVLLALASPLTAAAQEGQPPPAGEVEPEYVEPLTEPLAVIPPGHEELFAAMLGRNVVLPGECAFTNGRIDRDNVVATYTCGGGSVVFRLLHPDTAPPEATLTEHFALTVQSGSPPAGLTEELAARIRAREGGFEWTWLGPPADEGSTRLVIILVAVLLAALLLWLVFSRPRRAKET